MREVAGVGAAIDLDERGRAPQSVGHLACPLHGDGGVGGAVDHQCWAGDLTESLGDVVAVAEAAERVGELVPVAFGPGRPLRIPRGPLAFAEDDAGDDLLHGLRTLVEPHLVEDLVGGLFLRVLEASLAAHEHECLDALGGGECGAQ